ncbi:SURF1 family protein [Sanguibacter antarcticus]|uniref:SURF1-like protein n=1 Tax=Sanguibacter antarcticus TaxID=372484 RepID=A0A2A9E362_9MICO|nr:SURF1 family protein [Sanguibacter antarcticus]PFG33378.1 cytochrome oxidase assembly protein ShyY1 [Sanguibacter antarcticus]
MSATRSRTPSEPADAHGGELPERTVRQWIVLWAGVLLLVVGCLAASHWQWNRYVARSAAIDLIESNYASAPVPIDNLLPGPGATVDPDDVWRSVTVHGHYDPERTALLRNRPVNGQASFHVLVPFVTDAGTVLVVNRGWLQYDAGSAGPSAVPAPPSGETTITVRLRANEPASTRGAPAGQVQAINVGQVLDAGTAGGERADGLGYDAYGSLASEDPAPAEPIFALPRPDTDPGSHLSYTFQWLVFAVGGFVGVLVLLRREKQERVLVELDGTEHPFAAGPAAPGGRRRRDGSARVPSAEEIEDALIDAQDAR